MIGEVPEDNGTPVPTWVEHNVMFQAFNDNHAQKVAENGYNSLFRKWKLFRLIGSGGGK